MVALDTVHNIRHRAHVADARMHTLAKFLDDAAELNAVLDRKHNPSKPLSGARLAESSACDPMFRDYCKRLTELEKNRPAPETDGFQFDSVKSYREAVVELSLGKCVAIVERKSRLDDGIRLLYEDSAYNLLFRMAMLCQIIDDLWDVSKDRAHGLPSFVTASDSTVVIRATTTNMYGDLEAIHLAGEWVALRWGLRSLWLLTRIFNRLLVLRP